MYKRQVSEITIKDSSCSLKFSHKEVTLGGRLLALVRANDIGLVSFSLTLTLSFADDVPVEIILLEETELVGVEGRDVDTEGIKAAFMRGVLTSVVFIDSLLIFDSRLST